MGLATWFDHRRFGMLIDVSLAAVPGWAPVGQQAAWYRAHIDPLVRDAHLHPTGLAEALHHHRDRWAHVEQYDDFLPFLHFDRFDPDEWATLARDAGMTYAVMTAKHHDGLCWWDAPATDFTVMHDGPARNVLGQLATACERSDIAFGATYSLLDWHDDRYPTRRYVDEVVHPQVRDLIDRFGVRLLWGEGHWGASGEHWRSDELHAAVRSSSPDVVVNDRWWATDPGVRTWKHLVPAGIVNVPWEFRRPLGTSAAFNRAEPSGLMLNANEIVSLLTEVVAKGGHFLVQIGPDASGAFPEHVVERLRTVGGWVRRHQRLVDEGRPWETWGDAGARFLSLDDDLYVIDVSGQGRFVALTREHGRVTSVTTNEGVEVPFEQDADGVHLTRPPRKAQRMPAVYRIELEAPPAAPIELFPTADPVPAELAPLLGDARPGDIVQLGDGVYVGPARIPDGVVVRGLGPQRTTIDGAESVAVTLGTGSRLEHCRTKGGGTRIGRLPCVSIRIVGDGASMVGCDVIGHIAISGAFARITSSTAAGVVASGANRVEVLRSTLTGMGTDVGIEIQGGAGHLIDSCTLTGHLAAIVLERTVGATIHANKVRARWWGVRLEETEASDVVANAFERTMRAVDVDGGTETRITGNAVADGDSGCLLQNGASNTEVSGNYWARCRVGLLAWGAGAFRHRDNTAADLGDDASSIVTGP